MPRTWADVVPSHASPRQPGRCHLLYGGRQYVTNAALHVCCLIRTTTPQHLHLPQPQTGISSLHTPDHRSSQCCAVWTHSYARILNWSIRTSDRRGQQCSSVAMPSSYIVAVINARGDVTHLLKYARNSPAPDACCQRMGCETSSHAGRAIVHQHVHCLRDMCRHCDHEQAK